MYYFGAPSFLTFLKYYIPQTVERYRDEISVDSIVNVK